MLLSRSIRWGLFFYPARIPVYRADPAHVTNMHLLTANQKKIKERNSVRKAKIEGEENHPPNESRTSKEEETISQIRKDLVFLFVLPGNLLQNVIEAHVRVEATHGTSGGLDGSNACGERQSLQTWIN